MADKLTQEITAVEVCGESIKPTSHIFIPLIPVNVFIQGTSDNDQPTTWYEWRYQGLPRSYRWTRKEELPTISRLKQTTEDLGFPSYIPITWLHNAKTGTVLSFTVHGFYTQLTCCSNVYINNVQKSFEKEFNIHIKGLQKKVPFYCSYNDQNNFSIYEGEYITFVEPAFFEQKLLRQKQGTQKYEYGDKPFISIEQLVIDHSKATPIILLLLQIKEHFLQGR